MIDFTSDESQLLLNPRLPDADWIALEALYDAAQRLPASTAPPERRRGVETGLGKMLRDNLLLRRGASR